MPYSRFNILYIQEAEYFEKILSEFPPFNFKQWNLHEGYRLGIDLVNLAWWKEAYTTFELLWKPTDRVGLPAVFLQAFLQISAAGIKWSAGQNASARFLLHKSLEKILLVRKDYSELCGVDLDDLAKQLSCIESVMLADPTGPRQGTPPWPKISLRISQVSKA